MKVLIVNTYDTRGGAARAALRLHRGLRGIDIASEMLVQVKETDDRFIHGPVTKCEKVKARLRPQLSMLPLSMNGYKPSSMHSPAALPDELASKIRVLNPAVVNLHWLADGFFRVETLQHMRSPIVWTLHDMWAFTGGCHYAGACKGYEQSCGRCPNLGSRVDKDLSRRVWNRKKSAWEGLEITVVAPSRWIRDRAASSSLFAGMRIEVIPNGLNTQTFKPLDKHLARHLLSLPKDKQLILFGASGALTDKRKGFQLLMLALQSLKSELQDQVELLVFGASNPSPQIDFGLRTNYTGVFRDEISLAILYAAADAFIAPSTEDNLPNTVMEAMACGTPCVAFNTGGLPEMIDHGLNGYLATPFEHRDLSNGIRWVLEEAKQSSALSFHASDKASTEYDFIKQAHRYNNLYDDLLEGRERDHTRDKLWR